MPEQQAMYIGVATPYLIVPLQAHGATRVPPLSSSLSSQHILQVFGSAFASLEAVDGPAAVALSALLTPKAGSCGLGKRMVMDKRP